MNLISQEQNKEDRTIRKDNELPQSYSYFSELRKKIILKEKEIAERRNKELKRGHKNESTKVTYRTFDEFYKYKKKYEDYESKIKNETWKCLNKSRYKERDNMNNDIKLVPIEKRDEKYSYSKFKMERAGTVKQLKEYFQQIQNEKLQKKNQSLLRKSSSKNYSTPLNDNNIIIEKKETDIKQDESNQVDSHTEQDNINDLNIKTDNNKITTKNIDFSGNSIVLIKKNNNEFNDDLKREISIEREDTNEGGSTLGRGSTFEREDTEEMIEDEIFDEQIENMDKTEINLLYNLINEMKKGYENDEDYISNLIEELHNTNKGYMVDKILHILKKFDKNVKPYQISKLSAESEESIISKEMDNPQAVENQIVEKREEWDGSISDKVDRDEASNSVKLSLNSEAPNSENLENADAEKDDEPIAKKDDEPIEEKGNEKNDERNDEKSDERNEERNDEKSDERNEEKKKEDKNDSQFDWFYSNMDDICKREINSSMDQNIINDETKEYSSDSSEKQNLFLWLDNKHVENVIIEESQIEEDTI
ncbi:hypothetical protein YYG_03059 [Plasmodium vinckei petteri]|uniref:Uncharacterized protein n=1 Tax=Plasmodium vinckei petteri TaxID=138298 RepID=W7B1L5_PLAVN|nr:hypothetical protein YYG_03059 [Plasmodium vinckei petteri]CAD2098780.1 conserved Plasmodium protein, unknown function [Plasmodium vinckei petteri]